MERLLKILLLLSLLYIIETAVSFILFGIYRFITHKIELYNFNADFKDAIFFAWARINFYSLLQIALIFWLSNKIQIENKLLKIILLNCGLFVILSILYAFFLIPDTREWLTRPFFYILIISTALSPILLNLIPYFRRLINAI